MENIEIGFLLMAVGMTTVFAILLIVIYLGKGLISLVNRYAPEEAENSRKANKPAPVVPTASAILPEQEIAAVAAAVSLLTHGQGRITKIEKI